jgi:putative hydrolase of the HAD superfamily
MVDVDGVIIRSGVGERWDVDLERDLGVKPDALQRVFFAHYWRGIMLGEAAIEPGLTQALSQIAPDISVEALLAYWFARDADLDFDLLEDLGDYRRRGLKLHLATTQEHRRAQYLWTTLNLKDRFDGLHYSAALGVAKPDPSFFAAVEARTGFSGEDILLIDDAAANIDAAVAFGWQGLLWSGPAPLKPLIASPPPPESCS